MQRDSEGRGLVETDPSKQGWVPAGCLLETKVPVSVAIEEAANATRSNTSNPPEPVSRTPILPLSILSTSFPGVALMEYRKKGDEELDLQKDDALRVFKRYNHWSYVSLESPADLCVMLTHPSVGCQRGHRRSRLGPCTPLSSNVCCDLNSPLLSVMVHWQGPYSEYTSHTEPLDNVIQSLHFCRHRCRGRERGRKCYQLTSITHEFCLPAHAR